MHIAFLFAICDTRLTKSFDRVQRYAHCFVAVVRVRFRKTKERDHSLGIGSLNVRARLHEDIRRSANKLFRQFAEHWRLTVFRQIVFVGDIANYDRGLISFRFRIKRNVARNHALHLLVRQPIAEKRARGHGATALRNGGVTVGHDKSDRDREHRRQRLEKDFVKRANPGNSRQLNQQSECDQCNSPASQTCDRERSYSER